MISHLLHAPFIALALGLPALLAAPQDPAPAPPRQDEPTPPPPRVTVPLYPNVACPIMGKPISMRLTVDTELGRFWVCCKGCDEDILEHVEDAHRTAYPVVERLENEVCPISGKPVGEEPHRMVLQGFDFALCCAKCVPAARADSQVVLARLNDPELVDLGNRTCPVSGEPADPRTFAAIDGVIVRFATPLLIADAERDPDAVLARARELRERELEEQQGERAEPPEEQGSQPGQREGGSDGDA